MEEPKSVLKDLKDNSAITINGEYVGEPEPECCSSAEEFRYRVWDCLMRWRWILLCW